ncbi:hypothetical protein JCM10296v2_006780 [Rhodotorula toruloides]
MPSAVHKVLQARQWKPCAACTPILTFTSSHTSPLLKLPAELLHLIFKDVYRHKHLSIPPCRALFGVHDKLLAPRHKQVKFRYASALTAYCAALRMGGGLGPLCTSLVMVTGAWQFPEADADLLFHSLPNLRRLQLVDKSLIEPFFVCLNKSTTPLMPELITLTLEGTRDEGVDPYSATQLALLAKLVKLKTLAVRYHDRLNDVRQGTRSPPSTLPTVTRLILRTSEPASSARLVQACTALEQLEMVNLATTNDGWSALLAVAPEPGSLRARTEVDLKIPKEITRFASLRSLTLNSGCTARDKPSFEHVKRLKLEELVFGRGTVVSASHLRGILTGTDKLVTLRKLSVSSVTAYCRERPPERSDESEHSTDPYEMQRWLKSGSRMLKWTKTFSREACLDLIAVAAREGVAFEGETPNAPSLEKKITARRGDYKYRLMVGDEDERW